METRKPSSRLTALRVLLTAALVACILFIFHNSLQNGAASSQWSRAVTDFINRLLAGIQLAPIPEAVVRKLAHFCEFALLGFLLMLCLRVYTARFVRHVSWPLLGGMTTALCDETLQYLSAGRAPSVKDVWIDTAGVVAGLFAALLLLLVVRLLTELHAAKKENRILRAEHEAMLRAEREAEHARLARRALQRAKQDSVSNTFTNDKDETL